MDNGNTVITIEHNQEIIKRADWIIDIGPESGEAGGEIMFQGTPSQLLKSGKTMIEKYL